MKKTLLPVPAVFVTDRDGQELSVESLAGRVVKRTCRRADGGVIAILDAGPNQRGLSVRFSSGADYDRCVLKE